MTSQLPVERRHEIIGDSTYADATLDHLVQTLIASNSLVKACAGPEENGPKRLDQTPSPPRQNRSASEARDPDGFFGIGR
jgi:hypothetical protein